MMMIYRRQEQQILAQDTEHLNYNLITSYYSRGNYVARGSVKLPHTQAPKTMSLGFCVRERDPSSHAYIMQRRRWQQQH